MKLKDYSTCSSAEKLFLCCCQNAMIMFMDEQKLAPSLKVGHYLYHDTYHQAISDKATPGQVYHAFAEIGRYCHDHHDCDGDLPMIFARELSGAIAVHGQRIHGIDLQLHGRGIQKN